MKHTRVYEQPTSTTIHITNSHFLTTSSSKNSGVNKKGDLEININPEEGGASGAHAKLLEWEE
ncbi:hypothetical protein [Prevotella intermedia]|uniref:hypothetical protein n=1 Tax=Prevotella intermedia TaxID=28131 RepID=UPI000BE71910|nr:hypothetical protein [Prevotella intermedia]PDP67332.1 hypothetical protein CLI70_11755 [Prevotella intermedia]